MKLQMQRVFLIGIFIIRWTTQLNQIRYAIRLTIAMHNYCDAIVMRYSALSNGACSSNPVLINITKNKHNPSFFPK